MILVVYKVNFFIRELVGGGREPRGPGGGRERATYIRLTHVHEFS